MHSPSIHIDIQLQSIHKWCDAEDRVLHSERSIEHSPSIYQDKPNLFEFNVNEKRGGLTLLECYKELDGCILSLTYDIGTDEEALEGMDKGVTTKADYPSNPF